MADAAGRMHQVLELLSKFSLSVLDSEWTKDVIDADFTDVGDLPSEFEDHHLSTNLSGLFSAVNNSFRHWVDLLPSLTDDNHRKSTSNLAAEDDDDDSVHTRFWTELADDVKRLMTLLFYYCHRGQRYDAREAERELGIQAASLYFLLLCVPGSNAFRVFHPVMYLKCTETMRLATKLQVSAASPKKGRTSNAARTSQRRHQEDQMGTEVEEEDSEMPMLTPSEATKLVRSLNILLHDFLRLTQRFSLKHSPESLDETISILIDVSCAETYSAQGIFVERHGPATITALAYNSYVSLQSLCNNIHGQKKKTVLLIMKHILHNILMVPRGLTDLSGRSLNVIREHSQIFVKYLLMQVKEEAYDGVYILIQHLCLQVPDKAEFRQKTAQSVVEILRFLPTHLYVRLIKWFFKFSHNEKAGHRLFMLEVISKMLGEVERSAEGSKENTQDSTQHRRLSSIAENEENEEVEDEQQLEGENSFCAVPVDHPVEIPHDRKLLSHKFLLSIIFSRCRDSAASVRSKALILLAECTLSNNRTIMLAMQQIFVNNKPRMFTTPHIPRNNINLESPMQEDGEEEDEELEFPNASMVVAMLHRRALDGKVTVRKSALQVLENLMKLHNDMLSSQNLAVLAEHCRDPALLIRKQMVVSLTSLLEHYPQHKGITTTWIKAVLPLILDPEVKVQERVVEALDQLLFQRVLQAGHPEEHTPENLLPWSILSTLTKCSYHKFFNKVLLHWSKMDNSRPQVVKIVKSHIGQEHNEEAWTLLAMLSGYITIKNVTFAVDYFEQHCQNTAEVGSYTLLQVLKVLSNSMKHVPGDRAEDLHCQLLLPLSSFSVGAELISSMMDTVTLLTYTLHGDDVEGQKSIEKWVAPILKTCDDHLKGVLFQRADPLDAAGEEKLYRHLFTMGEAAMLCPQKVNKRMFLMLQSLIFHQQGQEGEVSIPTVPSTQTQCSQPTTITFTPTIRLKALSVVTLGKMCLQHEEQAKRIIPALGCMLTASTHPAIKNNILFTLTDMCVRYATLVDPLMDQVTACLRDPHPQVHRTALTLLISLLQEDYLKLKGSFFYRILQCLTEKDEQMREMVVFYITERLVKRFPKILCQHFIECIFHYNCYEEHESYNRFSQSSLEKEVFSLAGREHSHERHAIYHFMLDHMPDDQRFMTTQRLCQDVLGAVVDGRIKLNKNSMPMLEDTLTVLRSDEIKLATLKSRPEDTDQPTDKAEEAAMAGMVIKKTIISQVVKQNVIENIVPILIAVKHKLEEQRSPLMKHLLLYLKELMKDYKNEVKEILAGDKQLAKEIEFDLRRFDKEQWEEKNLSEETDQRVLTNQQTNNRVDNSDTLGASPALRERRLPVVEEQNAQKPPVASLPQPASIKELHTRAQVFSKDSTARRKSVCIAACVEGKKDPSKLLKATVRLRRISIADFRENNCDAVIPAREETTHIDPRAIGGYPPQEEEGEEELKGKEGEMEEKEEEEVESEKDESGQGPVKNKTRLELLRAISTPSTDRTLISNLTFINETQELSAINMDSTVGSVKGSSGELQLRRTSPTAHKQESDFSRLRRTSKDLKKDPTKLRKGKSKDKRKKVSGGLFESFETENSQSEAESTCDSDVSAVSSKSVAKRSEGKRTRHAASLSPDPEKTKSDTNTEKPKLKKHRKKT